MPETSDSSEAHIYIYLKEDLYGFFFGVSKLQASLFLYFGAIIK